VTVVLVHLAATLPTALVGLAAMWRLHFRVSEIREDAAPDSLTENMSDELRSVDAASR
jgi:hypothetical protein